MKRIVVFTVLLLGVFSLGYGIGRSPYFTHEEMPSPQALSETASLRLTTQMGQRALRREKMKGTLDFLDGEIAKYQAEYRKTPSPTLQAIIDDLVDKRDASISLMMASTGR